MHLTQRYVIGALFLALFLLGCRKAPPAPDGQPAPSPEVAAEDMQALVAGSNAFAFDLYGKVRTEQGNLIVSPASVSTALAMTYAGAKGETAKQMAKALRFALPSDKLHPAYAKLLRDWSAKSENRPYQLRLANSLWGQEGTTWQAGFLQVVKTHYGSGVNDVDFGDPGAARKKVNGRVAEQTGGRIKEVLPPQSPSPLTRLLLANAIYFKSTWEKQFDKAHTRPERFYLRAEEHIQAPMMRQTNRYGYLETDDLRVLSVPYSGKDLSMVILLPSSITKFGELEKSLSASKVEGLVKELKAKEVSVYLPRFKLEKALELSAPLQALGMKDAFSANAADFSGMTGNKELFIGNVFHKAFVEVNEEGTEAAGATVVEMKKEDKGPAVRVPPEFRADQPFVFLIRDNRNGTVLFLGRVVDPRK